MADETIGIDIILNAGEAATSVKELRQNIKDLQAAALKAGAEGNDALASKFTAAAGKARDRVADLNKEINVLQDTGSKLGALTAVGRNLAGGFAAAAGASVLFGNSQKDVQEQIAKVQAATALLAGVQELADVGKQIRLVKIIALEKIETAQKYLQIQAEEGGIIARNLAAAAQWALNAAMAANPIGAVIVVVAALAVGLYALATSTDHAAESAKNHTDHLKRQSAALKEVLKNLKEEQELAKDGVKNLERENELLKASGASKKDIYESDKKIVEQKIKDITVQYAAIQTVRNLSVEEINIKTDLYNKLKVLQAAYLKGLRDDADAEEEKNKKIEEGKKAEALKKRKELIIEIAKVEIDLQDSIDKTEKDKKDKEQKAKDDEMTNAVVAADKKIQFAAKTEKTIYDNKKLLDAQTLKDEQSIRDAKLNIAQQTLNGLTSLSKLAGLKGKEAENLQKGLAIVQIAIDTAKAISSTIAGATAAAAAGGPAAPFLMVSYITSGIATVLGAMASAKAALSSAGSSPAADPSINVPGVSGGGGSAPLTPTSSNAGNTSTTISESGQVVAPMVVKAYVVESEMTQTQLHVKSIVDKAQFP